MFQQFTQHDTIQNNWNFVVKLESDIVHTMFVNSIICLDGKGNSEGISSCSRFPFWNIQKGNGTRAKNDGSADTERIRFVKQVFVCCIEGYKIKCSLTV